MIPRPTLPLIVATMVGLSACQPGPTGEGEPASGSGGALGETVPANYDWRFTPHGGSADLDFGDGDWAEGVSLFHLSCLPRSRRVEASWGHDGEAVLTAATATGTFQAEGSTPTDHPVFAALRETGSLALGREGSDLTLTGTAQGKAEIGAFFDYCESGAEPLAEPEVAARPEGSQGPEAVVGTDPAATDAEAPPAPAADPAT